MATLREYFFAEFQQTLTFHYNATFALSGAPDERFTIVARAHYDEASFTRFVSYFVPEPEYRLDRCAFLIGHAQTVLTEADKDVGITLGHASDPKRMTLGAELPFSDRVFLYIDRHLSTQDESALYGVADQAGTHLQVRDRRFSDFQTLHETPWAFISHDSRDNDELVRPLANKLRSMMCPVWYDEYSLKVGDSVRESIDKGLSEAPKCIVVLSRDFLSNPGWTKAEFNAAVGKHFSKGGAVLLPIWHGVSRAEVADYSPIVADIAALRSDIGVDELAGRLYGAIRRT